MTIHLNGEQHQVPAPTSLAQLIAPLALAGKRFAVEHNGEIVPKAQLNNVALADQDKIEIVIAVGGG
ncbi:MAG: sulfur carrier protein ThiS [Betaproteobacteria bacterium]|nr:sulfur carrier protein ThiS [Betaproteobacteria bacterium]